MAIVVFQCVNIRTPACRQLLLDLILFASALVFAGEFDQMNSSQSDATNITQLLLLSSSLLVNRTSNHIENK